MSIESIRATSQAQVPENVLRLQLTTHGITEGVAVVGTRGFYKSIAGAETGKNLIGVYDDAISIVTPSQCRTFLGNTDPSRTIKDRAILQLGKYRYVRGIHGITGDHPRPAWVQAGPVTIRRFREDGSLGPELKDQWIGCNIHDGSQTTTGSAGCQTVVPELWKEFDGMLDAALQAAAQHQFWYVLSS